MNVWLIIVQFHQMVGTWVGTVHRWDWQYVKGEVNMLMVYSVMRH